MKSTFSLLVLAALCSDPSHAASSITGGLLVRYEAPPGNEFAPNAVAGGLTATPLGPGTSLANLEAGAVLPGTVFFNPSLASPTPVDAFQNEQFFEFTLGSHGGGKFQPLLLSFSAAKGAASSPRGWVIHTSLDGFSDPLASSDVAPVQPGTEGFTVPLDSLGVVTGNVTLRIYGYSPAEGAGLFFDDIEIQGLVASMLNPLYRPDRLLGAAGSVVHAGRLFHRELEHQSHGRTISGSDCFYGWGNAGIDWLGGGPDETFSSSGGLAFRMPRGLVGQVASSAEATRGADIDVDTLRLGFAIDNGATNGPQWLAYVGGFATDFDATSSDHTTLETSGIGFQSLASFGWWMRHGQITWGPVAAIEYLWMDVDPAAYENSAIPARVALDALDSFRTMIGVRARHDPAWRGFEPYAFAHLATEWSGADSGEIESAVGRNDVNAPYGRGTSLVLGAGVSSRTRDGFSVWGGYLGEVPLSANGMESHGLRFGIHASF